MTDIFKKAAFSVGQQVVTKAHAGIQDAGDYVLSPDDCEYILYNCDFTQPRVDEGGPVKNRDLKDRRIKTYVESIGNKGVLDTGDTLKFDTNGNLFDGRHRLATAIKMGIDFPTLIAFGRSPKAFSVIDGAIGAKSKTELFGIANILRGACASSVTDRLMSWRGDHFAHMVGHNTGEQLVDFYRANLDDALVQDCMQRAEKAYKTTGFPTVPTATLTYILRTQGDAEKANLFLECMATGLHSGKYNAIKVLLKYFAKLLATPGMNVSAMFKLSILICTWNNFCIGKSGNATRLSNAQYNIKPDLTVR